MIPTTSHSEHSYARRSVSEWRDALRHGAHMSATLSVDSGLAEILATYTTNGGWHVFATYTTNGGWAVCGISVDDMPSADDIGETAFHMTMTGV